MCAIAEKIAEDGFDIFLLKVAIWFHNLDRSTHPDLGGGATRKHEYIERVIRGMLSNFPNEFGVKEIAEIIDAVLKHHKLNHDSDSPLLVHLKDCDRLDIGAIGILRTGAHRHDIPPYDKSDFAKHSMVTREAELPTMIHGLHFNLEWEAMLRLPKAKILGKSRFDFIRTFLTMCQME
ncbi:HD domain-containing protein, partial [Candidatus Peregrinibacteria bacterium]|nr:HD domain-containing protein [Candidatus Peregrinibacteria bacterium]